MVVAASAVIVIAGLKIASAIVVPVLLALFVATISAPPLLWLKNKGLPTIAAFLIVIFAISAIGLLLVSLVAASLTQFQSQIPFYEERLSDLYENAQSFADYIGFSLQFTEIANILDPTAVAAVVGTIVNEIGALVANALLIFLIVIFILFEVSILQEKIRALTQGTEGSMRLAELKNNIQRYLIIKTTTSLITGALVWILLTVLGVDFAILWALLAFMLNYVPNIGSIVAALPTVLLTLLQLGVEPTIWVIAGYVIINLVVGSIIEPRISGRHLGLSPLVVFLSLLFWGWILGTVGMFLSVPLTMIVRLIAESNPNMHWLVVILSDRVDDTAQATET